MVSPSNHSGALNFALRQAQGERKTKLSLVPKGSISLETSQFVYLQKVKLHRRFLTE
jgi:hypothetical protein